MVSISFGMCGAPVVGSVVGRLLIRIGALERAPWPPGPTFYESPSAGLLTLRRDERRAGPSGLVDGAPVRRGAARLRPSRQQHRGGGDARQCAGPALAGVGQRGVVLLHAQRIRAGVVAAAGRQRAGVLPAARGADPARLLGRVADRARGRRLGGEHGLARLGAGQPDAAAGVGAGRGLLLRLQQRHLVAVGGGVLLPHVSAVGPVAAAGAGGGAAGVDRRVRAVRARAQRVRARVRAAWRRGHRELAAARVPGDAASGVHARRAAGARGPRLVLERRGRPGSAARGGGARADRVGGRRAGGALGRPGAVRAVAGRVRPARRVQVPAPCSGRAR